MFGLCYLGWFFRKTFTWRNYVTRKIKTYLYTDKDKEVFLHHLDFVIWKLQDWFAVKKIVAKLQYMKAGDVGDWLEVRSSSEQSR